MGNVTLKCLVTRYKNDIKLLERFGNCPYRRSLLEKRIQRHKDEIAEYVSSDKFEAVLKVYHF